VRIGVFKRDSNAVGPGPEWRGAGVISTPASLLIGRGGCPVPAFGGRGGAGENRCQVRPGVSRGATITCTVGGMASPPVTAVTE